MNKDTIYIEPEDDITDIIAKIENSKSKIVALVPPKKAGVFRSVVNMKLISKASKTAEKNVVLVTVDPSITKLAAASKLPVAKNLQSAPSIPKLDDDIEKTSTESVDEEGKTEEEPTKEEPDEESEEKTEEEPEESTDDESDEDESEDESTDKEEKPKKKSKKAGNRFINWIKDHKKLTIVFCILAIAIIAFLIWALFIAPAVNVFVSIKTDTNNFSQGIDFVKELSAENATEGKLYLEERKIETVQEVSFKATGQKNIGDKAGGVISVHKYFKGNASVPVNAGTTFTNGDYSFTSNEAVTLSWDGSNLDKCANNGTPSIVFYGCLVYADINVTAARAGSSYNIPASDSWGAAINVDGISSKKPMTGGTDNIITVVQQIDVEKARNELAEAKESENKEKLYETIPEDSIILESTFSQVTPAATSTPAVDEEVKDGTEPTLKATTTTSVFIIDRTKLEEFIRSKVDLPENKKIYEIRNIYIDNLREAEGNYSGKIKAVYFTGPSLTETELVEKIMGKGLGDARREISDVDGVSEVKMNPSYPWVFVVPTDSNRISVTFEIKDQNGETIEEQPEKKSDSKKESDDKKESSDSSDQKEDDKKE